MASLNGINTPARLDSRGIDRHALKRKPFTRTRS
jgi:hypothetical protein